MKFTTFVTSKEDILACAAAPNLEEVLIEPRELSREGRLSLDQAQELAREAARHGLKPTLVWDILMTQTDFINRAKLVAGMNLDLFSAIRTQCPGAAMWVRENAPEKPLQFVVENSNHNMPALKRWVANLRPQRVVLSTQLPEDKLIACCQELDTECEVLGAGKILLFYSKRNLLQANFGNDDEGSDARWIYADSSSEESASRPFPTIENEHGTFMYLNKDHFILDSLARLEAGGMHTIRIDLRDLQAGDHAAKGIDTICAMTIAHDPGLDTVWSRPTSAPFFKRNRTDKQFARMKPQTRLLRDAMCVAEVVSVERGALLGLLTLREFDTRGASFKFVAHDGSELPVELDTFSDVAGNPLTRCSAQKVVRCPWVKGVKAGSILVRDERV
jgi:putative protease